MYKIDDLDEPIKIMASNLENLENGKECFHVAVRETIKQINKIQDILRSLQKSLTGEAIEFSQLVRRTRIIDTLSIKFDHLLNAREAELMNFTFQKPTAILPS